MATPRDEARARRYAMRAAAGALLGSAGGDGPGRRRSGAAGVGAAIAAVSLTVAAGIGLFGGHQAAAQPAARASSTKPASVGPSPSVHPSPSPPASPWQRPDVLIIDESSGIRYVFRAGQLRPIRNGTSAFLILGTPAPKTMRVAHATLAGAATGKPIGISGLPAAVPPVSALVHGGWVVCSGPAAGSGAPEARIVASTDGSLSTSGFVGYGSGLTGGVGLGGGGLVVSANGVDYLLWQQHRDQLTDPAKVFAAWKWTGVTPLPIATDVLDSLPAGAAITPSALGATIPVRARLAPSSTLCVALSAGGHAVHTVMGATVGAGVGPAHLIIPAHHGVLVRASATTYLVTDSGTRYQIANAAARASLGYRSAAVVSVPSEVLDRLPKGPMLSRFVAIND